MSAFGRVVGVLVLVSLALVPVGFDLGTPEFVVLLIAVAVAIWWPQLSRIARTRGSAAGENDSQRTP